MSSSTEHVTVADGYVPVIDLSGADAEPAKSRVANAIGTACATSGFFVAVGHGVDQECIDRMYATTRAFFELPAEEKAKVAIEPGTVGFLGDAGSASKSMGKDAPPDLTEAFLTSVLGDRSAEERSLGDATKPWTAANRWPDAPTEFRAVWHEYTVALERLATRLIRLFALALGLPEDFFDDKTDNHMSTLTANYYYPLTTPPLPGQLRKGPHTDWGTLTILYQDDVGGLQVEQQGQGWREVPHTPGSFVVNIGDLMAFWTAGRWVSTMHRVRNPVEGQTNSRITIPFFHMPNQDALVEPLFPFSDDNTEQRYGMLTTPGEWYMARLADMID